MKAAALLALTIAGTVTCLNNGQGKVPPMGWSTWYALKHTLNEANVNTNTQQLVALGLRDAGYNYVNIDDAWSSAARDPNGHILANATKFPNGMSALASNVHTLGMKFGISSAAGTAACVEGAGSLTFESQDAADFASWGVDYLKYNDCNGLGISPVTRFATMRDALAKTGRGIYYSLSKGDIESYAPQGPSLANSWRTSVKAREGWDYIRAAFMINDGLAAQSSSGAWNDPDFLVVGLGWLTHAEEQTQFALWSIAKAPLLISTDLTNIPQTSLNILLNKNLIAVNQDPSSHQGYCVMNCIGKARLYGGPQRIDSGGQEYYAAVAVNWDDLTSQSLMVDFRLIKDIVCANCVSAQDVLCDVYDMWSNYLIGKFRNTFNAYSMEPHASNAYKFKCKYSAPFTE